MISVRKIGALYQKNMKNIFYNPFIITLPVLIILLAYLYGMILPDDATSEQVASMMIMIVLMNVLMGGANTMATLIAEEKEKNTLNVLISSTVSSLDFLISNVLTAATLTIVVNSLVYFIMRVEGLPFPEYLLISSTGSIAAITLGATLGLLAKNQAAASTLGTPLIALVILPPIFAGNFLVDNVLYYLFTEQIAHSILDLVRGELSWIRLWILIGNFVVFSVIFGICYRKRGLDT